MRVNQPINMYSKPMLAFALWLVVATVAFGRDYASKRASEAAITFLQESTAVTISDQTMYLDGGSISYKMTSPEGRSFVFPVSADNQRRSIRYFLNIREHKIIRLLPEADSGLATKLLIQRAEAGGKSRLQQRYPEYADETTAFLQLLRQGGHADDMAPLLELANARMKRQRAARSSTR